MKIYTKTGDLGETGLFGGPRVSKSDLRVEAYGEVDELTSLLGLVRSYALVQEAEQALAPHRQELADLLGDIQLELFLLSSELATPDPNKVRGEQIAEADVERLEQEIDRCDEVLEPLKSFILPGGSPLSAWLQWARTVCRRAERAAVRLTRQEGVELRPQLVRYLNRLSDLLFALGRLANHHDGADEVLVSDLRQRRAQRRSP